MTKVFVSVKDIGDQAYKWIDARFSLKSVELGKEKYGASHVVNAVHWDLNDDLSDLSKSDGRQPMPEKKAIVELLRASGLELSDAILIYDDGGNPFATRAWWFLQYAGFKNASILKEGFEEIKQFGIPTTSKVSKPIRTAVNPIWQDEIYASRAFVEKVVTGENIGLLVDARAANRYRGETEPLDAIAGHIPGAINFDWELLKSEGQYRFDETTAQQLAEIAKGGKELIVYCGSGVTASPLYAMLAHYGYDNSRLYVGSYSDWVSKEDAEVE